MNNRATFQVTRVSISDLNDEQERCEHRALLVAKVRRLAAEFAVEMIVATVVVGFVLFHNEIRVLIFGS